MLRLIAGITKYRLIFSNFTCSVAADKMIDPKDLGEASLRKMIKELERVGDLSMFYFNKQTVWSIDQILAVKDQYAVNNSRLKSGLDKEDPESKKGKKSIETVNRMVGDNDYAVALLDFVLKGFGQKVNELAGDIDKSMSVSDDF